MTNQRTCPKCGADNEAINERCVKCGVFLLDVTVPIATDALPLDIPEQIKRYLERYAGNLLLFIADQQPPVVASLEHSVFHLGRDMRPPSDEDGMTVDLSPYGATIHGVSRRHATLIIKPDETIIHDNNSTNGTWVNGIRLVPNQSYQVHNGDQLQLGRLPMWIYFA